MAPAGLASHITHLLNKFGSETHIKFGLRAHLATHSDHKSSNSY